MSRAHYFTYGQFVKLEEFLNHLKCIKYWLISHPITSKNAIPSPNQKAGIWSRDDICPIRREDPPGDGDDSYLYSLPLSVLKSIQYVIITYTGGGGAGGVKSDTTINTTSQSNSDLTACLFSASLRASCLISGARHSRMSRKWTLVLPRGFGRNSSRMLPRKVGN